MRLLTSSAIVLFACSGCMNAQWKLSEAAESLHRGMTTQEVHAVLGPPNRVSYNSNGKTWIYFYRDDGRVFVDVMNGTGNARANARLLALAFDPNGILQSWESN